MLFYLSAWEIMSSYVILNIVAVGAETSCLYIITLNQRHTCRRIYRRRHNDMNLYACAGWRKKKADALVRCHVKVVTCQNASHFPFRCCYSPSV